MKISLISHPEVSPLNHQMFITALESMGLEHEVLLPYNFSSKVDSTGVEYFYKGVLWEPTHIIHRSIAPFLEFMEPMLLNMEERGCKVLNPIEKAIKSRNKYFTSMLLEKAGIRVIPTLVAYPDVDRLPDFPFKIVKPSDGCKGEGVSLSPSTVSALADLEGREHGKLQLLQPHYGTLGRDFRAYVVNGVCVAFVERRAKEGDFRANLSLGGLAFKMDVTHAAAKNAENVARALGLEACGVDLLLHEGEYYVLEANAWAGFAGLSEACEVDIAGGIINFLVNK